MKIFDQSPKLQPKLQSIDELEPLEHGGQAARKGFNYQDHIAASFLIDMLEDKAILHIACETHDDIVAVRQENADEQRTVEFVQIKATADDQLWSISGLCSRDKSKPGTSIFEKSLLHDRASEASIFRLVTLRPAKTELSLLKLPRDHADRSDPQKLSTLVEAIEKKCTGAKSHKGNGSQYWVQNCFWHERHDEKAVKNENITRLCRFLHAARTILQIDQVEALYEELLKKAKDAGDANWKQNPQAKRFDRLSLEAWLESRVNSIRRENPAGGKLQEKLEAIKAPEDSILSAKELRRAFAAKFRTPRYQESNELLELVNEVQSEMHMARTKFWSGEIDITNSAFHGHCQQTACAIPERIGLNPSVFKPLALGCMYDIADRCMLRFERDAS